MSLTLELAQEYSGELSNTFLYEPHGKESCLGFSIRYNSNCPAQLQKHYAHNLCFEQKYEIYYNFVSKTYYFQTCKNGSTCILHL